jgi:trimeric autotransporter adhesin
MKINYSIQTKLLIVAISIMAQVIDAQNIVRVNANSTCITGSGCDGSTWAKAYKDVSTALANTTNGEIWVTKGIYRPTTDGNRDICFVMKEDVALYGGFNGTETARNQRNFTTNLTVLSADLNGNDVGMTNNAENSYHVVKTSYNSPTSILDGFSLSGGNANVIGGLKNNGGGMLSISSNMVIANCKFNNNYAEYGGAMAMSIYTNMPEAAVNPTITNCVFENNVGIQGASINIYIEAKAIMTGLIEKCTFQNNKGATSVKSTYGGGLTVLCSGASMTTKIRNCIFKSNTIAYGGAVNLVNGGTGNVVSPTFVNCMMLKNNTSYGGAIFLNGLGCTPNFINCTISGNVSSLGSAVMGAVKDQSKTAVFKNCIFWNQTSNFDNANLSVTNSNVQGGYTGSGNINADPKFVSVSVDDYHLQSSSPSINKGLNAANSETGDLDNFVRIQNTTIDMGAYEFGGAVASAPCVPATPATPSVSAITSYTAAVNWASVAGAIKYRIDYKTAAATTWTTIYSTTTSVNLTGLTTETVYSVRVFSLCTANSQSPASPTANFTTASCVAIKPAAPTVTDITSSSANVPIDWAALPNAISATIEYKLNSGTTWKKLFGTTTISGLSPETQYNVRMYSSCSATSISEPSAVTNFTTLGCTAIAPTAPVVTTIAATSAKIGFATVGGAISYRIEYKISTATTWTKVDVPSNVSTLTGLSANTSYNVRGYSFCSASKISTASPISNFKTLASSMANSGSLNNNSITEIRTKSSEIMNLELSPNPANIKVNLYILTNNEGEYDINVYNIVGKQVINNPSRLFKGENIINMSIENLPKGIYLVRVFKDNESVVQKLLIN